MRGPLWYVLSIFLVAIALTVAGFLSEAPARSQNYLAGRLRAPHRMCGKPQNFMAGRLSTIRRTRFCLSRPFRWRPCPATGQAIPLAEQLASSYESLIGCRSFSGVRAFKSGD